MHLQRFAKAPSWTSFTPALIVVMLVLFGGITVVYHKKCSAPSISSASVSVQSATSTSASALADAAPAANAAGTQTAGDKTASLCDGTCYTMGSLNTSALATAKRYVSDALTNQVRVACSSSIGAR